MRQLRFPPLLLLLLLPACNFFGRPAAPIGDFRFESVDDAPVPAEFPLGSGTMLEDGSLRIEDSGRFSLRFLTLGAQEVESTWNVQDGFYTVNGDSLFFTTDGTRDGAPARFRFERTADELRLWDSNGSRWSYSPRKGN